MYFSRLLIIALACLLTASCDQSISKHGWEIDVFDSASGQTHHIAETDIAHKLLVINYWAEWCKPCIAEIPELNRFAQAEQQHVVVIGVNFDNKQGTGLQEAMKKVGMAFPAALTKPETLFTLPEISGLPTTLILDEHGVLKKQLLGPQTYDSLEAAISEPQ